MLITLISMTKEINETKNNTSNLPLFLCNYIKSRKSFIKKIDIIAALVGKYKRCMLRKTSKVFFFFLKIIKSIKINENFEQRKTRRLQVRHIKTRQENNSKVH